MTLNYQTITPSSKKSRISLIVGWTVSALPVATLLFSASMKFSGSPKVLEGFAKLGYPQQLLVPLGIVEICCALIYLFPRTAFLGAILVTGYLGGATASHVRAGQPFYFPVVFGILAWLGLLLRDPRLRALLPLRSEISPTMIR